MSRPSDACLFQAAKAQGPRRARKQAPAIEGVCPAKHVAVVMRVDGNGDVVTCVADDGPGIPPELRHSALEPFFKMNSSRSSREGFGLGLPIVQEIVEIHGGRLTSREPCLRGLKIGIRLPAQHGSEKNT
jgi:signal transduction histidine kinase